MSNLDTADVDSEVYILEDKSEQVSTAKSQFADEYGADYSDLNGKKISKPGYGRSYPVYCVVVEVPNE